MGQEISQQNTCNIGRRQHQKPTQPKHHHHTQQKLQLQQQQNLTNSNEKYSKLQDTYSASNSPTIPSKSSKSEQHRKQQLLATPHSYVKSKITKKLSASTSSNASTASDYQNTSVTSSTTIPKTESLYYEKVTPLNYSALSHHQRKHSQSNDSGIYYSSSGSSCRRSSSSAASICGSTTGSAASTTTSCKSLDKQKNYLNHHLYIKSYLDILEEDEKARAHFQPARPGIRNYTPKILSSDIAATTTLSSSVPAQTKQRSKIKDDPWI